ncbi:related to fumarylacetoacetate hydrolase [Sporisorium reilianum SRZ2]|uniref:Fumarylacetoacetase n=1 Tax=Sporisorium reilianum (strain SRZ2) TaxID=999809 RepID=E6ZUC2_SPORE|nr:related to fumarylacetoacetate hydrolase [Sporisorium reilianum SRZ2]
MKCIVEYAADHPFSLANLPYGSFCTDGDASTRRCGVAIGDWILDLQALALTKFFPVDVVAAEPTLNAFMALDRRTWLAFRQHIQRLLSVGSPLCVDTTITASNVLAGNAASVGRALFVPRLARSTAMCLPCTIGDYTDFYTSLEHATNCGTLIRGPTHALQPNWRHLPVAYHARASSVVVSGTPVRRPVGQILDKPGDAAPIVAPSRRLDFELEVGFFYGGKETQLGERLSPAQAAERVFGAVLLNDWSARDVQTWEYVPLGPFLSKNFATTISAWIVPIHALEPFTCTGYTHDPPLLPYLRDADTTNFDVPLTVAIRPAESTCEYEIISRSSLRHTYYTIRQMIAHHSTTGCPLRAGDLLGTGTLSAPGEQGYGSLLEKCEAGRRPFALAGEERTFLEDGDSVRMSGLVMGEEGHAVGFGECVGCVLPALPL